VLGLSWMEGSAGAVAGWAGWTNWADWAGAVDKAYCTGWACWG